MQQRQRALMAAAPSLFPAPGPAGDLSLDEARWRLMGLLREARAEFQHLQATLAALRSAAEDAATTRAALDAAVDDATRVFDTDNARVTELFFSIRELLDGAPRLYAWCADEVTDVTNAFGDAAASWPRLHADPEDVAAASAKALRALEDAVFAVAALTAADRINEHLATLPVGGAADFDAILADELPDAERRDEILLRLSRSPIGLHGVVDVPARRIYRIAATRQKRVATLLVPPAALVLGALLIAGVAYLDNRNWVPAEWPDGLRSGEGLLVSYLFVTLGAVAHVGIGYLKRAREKGAQPLVVASVFWWLHVRFGTITLNVVWLWIAVLGLGVAGQTAAVTAFFAGYGIDSVADLFLKKFESGAGTRVAALTKALGGPSG